MCGLHLMLMSYLLFSSGVFWVGIYFALPALLSLPPLLLPTSSPPLPIVPHPLFPLNRFLKVHCGDSAHGF